MHPDVLPAKTWPPPFPARPQICCNWLLSEDPGVLGPATPRPMRNFFHSHAFTQPSCPRNANRAIRLQFSRHIPHILKLWGIHLEMWVISSWLWGWYYHYNLTRLFTVVLHILITLFHAFGIKGMESTWINESFRGELINSGVNCMAAAMTSWCWSSVPFWEETRLCLSNVPNLTWAQSSCDGA